MSYILAFLGIYYVEPTYTSHLSVAVRLLVCGFLMYRFHPFRTHELRDFDARLIFASAILIATDVGVGATIGSLLRRFPAPLERS